MLNAYTKLPSIRDHSTMKTSKRASSIFKISGIGQAPSKDFFSLTVVNNSIIWRTWRTTLRNEKTSPSETVQSWQEFTDTSNGVRLQGEIRRVFGNDILSRVNSLVSQCWLTYMKSDILVEIFVWLDVLDVVRLAQVRYVYLFHNWWETLTNIDK